MLIVDIFDAPKCINMSELNPGSAFKLHDKYYLAAYFTRMGLDNLEHVYCLEIGWYGDRYSCSGTVLKVEGKVELVNATLYINN